MKPISVDATRCTLCGLCTQQCSNGKIVLKEKSIVITDSDTCIACGHCYAVCPLSAIMPENGRAPERIKDPDISADDLLNLLRMRRSHRSYVDRPVGDADIKTIANFARYAPTGTNRQAVHYLFVKDKATIGDVLKESMRVNAKLFDLLGNPLVKFFGPMMSKRMNVGRIRRSLLEMMREYDGGGDPIFFGAPLIAFVSADRDNSSTPYDDCCYATYNMVLGAESIGLSSCINARAIGAVSHSRTLRKMLGFTASTKPYTCVNFGYPKYTYSSLVYRNEATVAIV
jgi:nitroreductase/NAD-dependent dihydropyrimidine dehydrogenase PreA subunit